MQMVHDGLVKLQITRLQNCMITKLHDCKDCKNVQIVKITKVGFAEGFAYKELK